MQDKHPQKGSRSASQAQRSKKGTRYDTSQGCLQLDTRPSTQRSRSPSPLPHCKPEPQPERKWDIVKPLKNPDPGAGIGMRRCSSSFRASSPAQVEEKSCWACSTQVLTGKLVCASCFKEAAGDNAADAHQVKTYIKHAVKEGLRSVSRETRSPCIVISIQGIRTEVIGSL